MEHLLGLLTIPVIVMLFSKFVFRRSFTWKEFFVLEGGMVVIVTGIFFIARWGALTDTEHWNGRIQNKEHSSMHCCHDYECNCQTCEECDTCTRSDGSSYECNCRNVKCNCQTCYEHSQDYYWALNISTGDTITLGTCESDEDDVPPIWTKAYVGEPAVVERSYQNWLLADKSSLYHHVANEEYLKLIPEFPRIHTEYKVKRVISIAGATIAKADDWQSSLDELNAQIGPGKQADITILVTKINDPTFADAVETKWVYGPKNGVIIVIGSQDGDNIDWARVVTISRVEEMKITLRDGLAGKKLSDVTSTIGFIQKTISEMFTRTHMTEFEYMASAATPSTGVLIFLYILAICLSIGGSILMAKKDLFNDEHLSQEEDLVHIDKL